jgi:uncharacterized protein (DUF2236 family)
MPTVEEAAKLVPRPGSVTWDYGGDLRIMAASGYALVLQVAHPTVAAGVRDHSDYARDPWGRLLRTTDYLFLMTYGGAEAALATGRRLREMHKRIRGTAPDGRKYSALEREPFAWVHATLIEAVVLGHERFGARLRPDQIERMYGEWLQIGELIGIASGELPEDWAGFRDYFDAMVDERLEHSDVVEGVLTTMTRPAPPRLPVLRASPVWKLARVPLSRPLRLATVGFLPERLRERFGLRWTRAQELELRALGRLSRASRPLIPRPLLNVGPGYLEWRKQAIARGELGPDGPGPQRRLAAAA